MNFFDLVALPGRRHDVRFDRWYSKFSCAKLTQLCEAAKLSYSGSKDDMIDRLSNHDLGCRFVWERSKQHAGLTNQDLKDICSGRGIAKSGNRFELVRRLLQHESQSQEVLAEVNDNQKKRAPLAEVNSEAPKKARPSKTKVLYNRIQCKIKSGATAKKYQSHMGAKTHSADVYELLSQTLQNEITSKKYVSNDPKKALRLAKACFTAVSDNFKSINMTGIDISESLDTSIVVLENVIVAAVESLNSEELEDTEKWIGTLESNFRPYDFGKHSFERMNIAIENAWLEGETDEGQTVAANVLEASDSASKYDKLAPVVINENTAPKTMA